MSSRPFPHVIAWNLPESFWEQEPDPPPGLPVDEEDMLWEAGDEELEKHYWNPAIMNGAIPICHRGCALRQWLVVNGEQKGYVWNDKPGRLPRYRPPTWQVGQTDDVQ